MPKNEKIDFFQLGQRLSNLLAQTGVMSTKDICERLDISQSTFSRLLEIDENHILVIGKGRATQYALKRVVDGLGDVFPLYQISEQGRATHLADLYAIQPKGFVFVSHAPNIKDRVYEDLPYFLEDMRPSGFLGRLIPKRYPQLDLPKDIKNWSNAHVLLYLTEFGWDVIGNFIIGDLAFQQYMKHRVKVDESVESNKRKTKYPKIAQEVLEYGQAGSSAAGEQPKFLVVRDGKVPVIVKFSPMIDDDSSQRWADLLVCEHIVHQILKNYGHQTTKSQILVGGKRLFLEKERFDRIGIVGRKGIISLTALDLQYVGSLKTWSDAAQGLLKQKIIDDAIFQKVLWLENFGNLIANTDMHLGNISFFTKDLKVVAVAPVYDMLPMLYRPDYGQTFNRAFEPKPPLPKDAKIWKSAYQAAKDFWLTVQKHKRVSSGFKAIAKDNYQLLESIGQYAEILT